MTPREETQMLRDIHRIALALESISKAFPSPIEMTIGDTIEVTLVETEETRE